MKKSIYVIIRPFLKFETPALLQPERLHESLRYQTPYEVYVKEPFGLNSVQAFETKHLKHPCFLF